MSRPAKDFSVGYGQPPKKTRWRKGQSGNPRGRYPKPSETALEAIDRLLLRRVGIADGRKVSALEMILLQLWSREVAGDVQAVSVRLKYEKFARECSERGVEINFLDSDYTRALAAGPLQEAIEDE